MVELTKYRICLIAVLMASLMLLGMLSGYFIFAPDPTGETADIAGPEPAALKEAASSAPETIGEGTKITYEYVYLGGHKEKNTTFAPKNWYGLTLTEFKDIFDSWQIKEFSSNEVILSKNLKAYSPNHYVLGVHDGYVAVFKKNEYDPTDAKTVRQITETPVSSLPETEQKRLLNGIDFYGDAELIRILEDYET